MRGGKMETGEYSKRTIRMMKEDGVDLKKMERVTNKVLEILREEKVTIRECRIIISRLSNTINSHYLAVVNELI